MYVSAQTNPDVLATRNFLCACLEGIFVVEITGFGCLLFGKANMKKILLVDDSTTILLSMGAILTKAGYETEKASSADEGLTKFKGGLKPDLLITDLNMPGMNGIDFIKEVRKLPNQRFMPILFLTTESQQSKRDEAKAAGASGWLVKPVDAEQLINTIKLVIK